jgi:hypothetical protein
MSTMLIRIWELTCTDIRVRMNVGDVRNIINNVDVDGARRY